MRNNANLIAAGALVIGFLGISNLPRDNSGGKDEAQSITKSNTQTASKGPKQAGPSTACNEILKRLRPFLLQPYPQANGQESSTDWVLQNSCYADGKAPVGRTLPSSLPSSVRFAIASVPNPITTHLPLTFDRMIEVIEQAAQDDKYEYDSSWFPWNEVSKDYPLLSDQRKADADQDFQQEQPGLVIFRRSLVPESNDSPYRDGLVVFVVAEQPTGGINRDEFDRALDWLKLLGTLTPERGLHILGPSFSGSLPSLDQALDSDKIKQSVGAPVIPVSVSSGTISSEPGFFWFRARVVKNHSGSFRTAMEGDPLMVERFLDYLDHQGYSLGRVAVISEDETAFGSTKEEKADPISPIGGSLKTDEKAETKDHQNHCHCNEELEWKDSIHLYYPRDIATLRSAYEKQSVFSTGKPSSGSSSTTLRGDLSEQNSSDHDTVRSYGGELTPLAQESVLLGITNILKEKRIEFILLRSTNSLDQIFLSQFFRRAYPAARVVIDGADLLFPRGAEGASLRGVMTLSTYPLLTWQQDWTPSLLNPKRGSYRVFGDVNAEGLYIAAREMFLDPKLGSDVPIGNYAPPAWAQRENPNYPRPATWLSVIGHHQFWPVAVFDKHPSSPKELLTTASERGDQPVFPGDNHPLRVPPELIVLLIGSGVWAVVHLVWCWRGRIARSPSPFDLAQFAPLNKKQHPALIAFGSSLPAVVAVVTAATCGLFDWNLNCRLWGLPALWVVLGPVVCCIACSRNFRRPGVSGRPSAIWQQTVGATALVGFALVASLHYALVRLLSEENRIPVYWRSAHLLSGVSPLLPQILLLVGMYLWFWFSLRGLALFGDDRAQLPKLASLPTDANTHLPLMRMFSQEEAADPVEERAIPAGTRYMVILLATFPTAVLIFWPTLGSQWVRTIGGDRLFGIMMFYWLSLCIAIILADAVQLWSTWRGLRPLLVYLDRLPLRRTLASLRGLSWGSVWSVSGSALEERYHVTSRQFESLRHLQNLIQVRSPRTSEEESVLKEIQDCLGDKGKAKAFVKWYVQPRDAFEDIKPLREFQEEVARIAGSTMTNLLRPAWQLETESLLFDRTRPDKKPESKKEGGEPYSLAIPDSVPTYVLAAEEFFLLPYLGFIQNILGRLRTIVLGSLSLFVASTLAVSSYPFDPMPVLGGLFLAVFLVTGGTITLVFAGMHRDATLSHITNSQPGELDGHFWLQLITFGIGPLLGLLTTLFPSITDFVSSWMQPGMQALK